MRIAAVIFDFGNVICFPPAAEAIEQAAEHCGLTPEVFLRAFWTGRLAYDGGLDPREYWRGVGAAADRSFDDALIARMVNHEIGFWSRFDERALQWIDELRALGIRTGILSNLPQPLAERLRATPGFLEHFDHVTFSCELRLVKPQAAIYEDAVKGLHVRPNEALFLDDREENVEGARNVGMFAELYEEWGLFEEKIAPLYGLPLPGVARRQ